MKTATMAEITDIEEQQTARAPVVQQTRAVATATPADLLRIAVEGGADLEKLERLMALQERWEANEARKAFVVAMTEFKAEPIDIFKRKEVSFTTRDGDTTSYKHAELSDVTGAIGPVMAKHKLSFRWDVKQEGPLITVDCIVTHVLGHSEKVTMQGQPDASGKKNAIQQVASTVSYLQRYTLLAATGTSTKGDDNDGRDAAPAIDTDLLAEWVGMANMAVTPEALRSTRKMAGEAFQTANDLQGWNAFKVMADAKKKELTEVAQ
jgi:hypothetical protein